MKSITVNAPKSLDCDMPQWEAKYAVNGAGEARLVQIQSRSAIDIVVAKIDERGFLGPQANYYVSSPNFGVAIPGIPSLLETHWITEQLLHNNMSAPDAVTIGAVLRDMEDF